MAKKDKEKVEVEAVEVEKPETPSEEKVEEKVEAPPPKMAVEEVVYPSLIFCFVWFWVAWLVLVVFFLRVPRQKVVRQQVLLLVV